jgi:hypothetical protein
MVGAKNRGYCIAALCMSLLCFILTIIGTSIDGSFKAVLTDIEACVDQNNVHYGNPQYFALADQCRSFFVNESKIYGRRPSRAAQAGAKTCSCAHMPFPTHEDSPRDLPCLTLQLAHEENNCDDLKKSIRDLYSVSAGFTGILIMFSFFKIVCFTRNWHHHFTSHSYAIDLEHCASDWSTSSDCELRRRVPLLPLFDVLRTFGGRLGRSAAVWLPGCWTPAGIMSLIPFRSLIDLDYRDCIKRFRNHIHSLTIHPVSFCIWWIYYVLLLLFRWLRCIHRLSR